MPRTIRPLARALTGSLPGRFKRAPGMEWPVKIRATLHGFTPKEREVDLPPGARADDAPKALGIRPELVLVFRDERPLPGDAPLRDGDHLRILRVVSGG